MTTETPQRWDENRYLEERVEDQLKFYNEKATQAKRTYTWIQTSLIILGVLVPVVVNLPEQWGELGDMSGWLTTTVTLMSLTLAILNGLLNFGKYQDLWLSFRMTAELLKHEKFLFLTASGKYTDKEAAFPAFVQTVESILSAEHNKFRSLIEDSTRPTTRVADAPAGAH